jgi:hypothetical protein
MQLLSVQKTRWGSCSSQNNINLNYLLMMAPMWVIDAVKTFPVPRNQHDVSSSICISQSHTNFSTRTEVCEIEDDSHLLQKLFCAVNSHEPHISSIH